MMDALGRWVIVMLSAGLIALASSGGATSFPPPALIPHDVTLHMDDGVDLAGTLYIPNSSPPEGGWPAIVFFHGLGGKRQDLDSIVRSVSGYSFVALAFDARGHGQSGGLVSVDGPREMADTREVYSWLATQPNVNAQRIGAWGMSLGGGAVMRSLVEGVPWKAVEVVETWTDLYSALAPQNLSKSGAIYSLLSSVPDSKRDPTLKAIEQDALASRNQSVLRAWATQRSSRSLLSKIKTPIYFFQGRRDFAFDIAQAKAGYALLKGPKRLYVGDFGHAPSTFPGPDFDQVMKLGQAWFTRYLVGTPAAIAPFGLAPSPWRGQARSFAKVPATRRLTVALPGNDHLAGAGRATRTSGPFTGKAETFGSASVRLTARLTGGWSRLVAVLTAQRGKGAELVVSEGGVNTTGLKGRRTLTIRLIDTATLIPRGARLTLTLASSSVAQNPGNLLYLNLPMPRTARIALGPARLTLPILRVPVSR
jgi:predicted acyl esterase